MIDPDIDQIVINRLCEILRRDLSAHHRLAVSGHTKQSDDLQAALAEYLLLYDLN
jgi:hypothetical protein